MPQRIGDGLKQVRGTARRDRKPHDTTVRLVRPPRPPAHLSQRAAAEWRYLAHELVQAGILTGADLRALELLAETLAMEGEMRAVIAAEGATIPAAEGGRKGHPALKIATEARSQAIRLLEAFGLTPVSRQRVDRAPQPVRDEAEAFLANGWRALRGLQAGNGAGRVP